MKSRLFSRKKDSGARREEGSAPRGSGSTSSEDTSSSNGTSSGGSEWPRASSGTGAPQNESAAGGAGSAAGSGARTARDSQATLTGSRLVDSWGDTCQTEREQQLETSDAPQWQAQWPRRAESVCNFKRNNAMRGGGGGSGYRRYSLRYLELQPRFNENFAAIHESLEEKLRAGRSPFAAPPPPPPPEPQLQEPAADKQQPSEEALRPSGMFGKFWTKLGQLERRNVQMETTLIVGAPANSRTTLNCSDLGSSSGSMSTLDGSKSKADHQQAPSIQSISESVNIESGELAAAGQVGLLNQMMGSTSSGNSTSSSGILANNEQCSASAEATPADFHDAYDWSVAIEQQVPAYQSHGTTSSAIPGHPTKPPHQQQEQLTSTPAMTEIDLTTDNDYQMPPLMSEHSTGTPAPQQQRAHYASNQVAIMVPTSDGGNAFFESNYGTLLSKSSIYEKLGYGNRSLADGGGSQHCLSGARSQANRQLGSDATSASCSSRSSSSPMNTSNASSPPSANYAQIARNCYHQPARAQVQMPDGSDSSKSFTLPDGPPVRVSSAFDPSLFDSAESCPRPYAIVHHPNGEEAQISESDAKERFASRIGGFGVTTNSTEPVLKSILKPSPKPDAEPNPNPIIKPKGPVFSLKKQITIEKIQDLRSTQV